MSKVKGWINPRYLDQKWFRNFSVSRDVKSEKDIPVIVEFDHESYKAAQCDNPAFTYRELLDRNKNQQTKITELEDEWGDERAEFNIELLKVEKLEKRNKELLEALDEISERTSIEDEDDDTASFWYEDINKIAVKAMGTANEYS